MKREPAQMAALAACCLFASGPLRGQEVSGRVRGTYQSSEGEAESFDSVLQSYEINFRNRVAPGLSYLARVRALATDLNPEMGAASGTDLPAAGGERDCTVCHQIHTGSGSALLKREDAQRTCVSCHSGHSQFSHPMGPGVEDRSRPGRPVECLSCHDPHGTAYPQFLLGDPRAELCTRCHEAG